MVWAVNNAGIIALPVLSAGEVNSIVDAIQQHDVANTW